MLTYLVLVRFVVLQGNDLAALVHLDAGLGSFSNLPRRSFGAGKIIMRHHNQATFLICSRPSQVSLLVKCTTSP